MEKTKTKAIVVKEDKSVDTFISEAIKQNLPVETMEKLFALREKVKAEFAREQFVKALASFQSECPIIKKTKKVNNKDGTLRYTFAPLDKIIEQIKKSLAQCGLSYTWDVENEEGKIKAICTITHILGHSQTSSFVVPIDTEGYMTAPQKYASALTFAKRYALTDALGISTGEEDTDATDVGKEKEAKSDRSKIVFLLRNLGVKAKDEAGYKLAVKDMTDLALTDKNFPEIVDKLEILVKEAQEHENSKV